MRLIFPLAACALAACTTQPAAENAASDVNIAETNVEANDAPAANDATPAPVTPPAPGEPGGLDNDTTPVSEAPFTEDSAQGAANVVQTYYALIGERKYRRAWALWRGGGTASGMSAQAFARSFDKYSEYRANVGAPGRIDAGAGQRYVTVPVQVYGRLKDAARPFNMRGSVVLHRAGDIDGATAEQRSWRIESTDIKPRPGEPTPQPSPTVDNRSTARYRCMDGNRIVARFDPDNRQVTVDRGGKRLGILNQQRVASGISYQGHGYALRAKGDAMTFDAPGQPPIACTVIR